MLKLDFDAFELWASGEDADDEWEEDIDEDDEDEDDEDDDELGPIIDCILCVFSS